MFSVTDLDPKAFGDVGYTVTVSPRGAMKLGPSEYHEKARQVVQQLQGGRNVVVTVQLKGQVNRSDVARRFLVSLSELVEDSGQVEWLGALEGRIMEMVLVPRTSPPNPPAAGVREPRIPIGPAPATATAVEPEP